MGKATKLDVSSAVVEVPHDHWRNGTLLVRGPYLAAGKKLAIARDVKCGDIAIMPSKELLLVRVVHILDDNRSTCRIKKCFGLDWVVVDHTQELAAEATKVL